MWIPEGSDRHVCQFEVEQPKSRLMTQDRVGKAPSVYRQGHRKKMSSDSRFEKASLRRDDVLGLCFRREIDVGGQWQPRVWPCCSKSTSIFANRVCIKLCTCT